VEVCYLLQGIIDIFQVLPDVVFHPIAFLFDQVLEFHQNILLFRIFSTTYSSSLSISSGGGGGF